MQSRITDFLGLGGGSVEDRLLDLYRRVQECRGCGLSDLDVNRVRPRIKFGRLPILVVSQNPSVYRDGLPYVQGALDKVEKRLGDGPLRREFREALRKVYVTNVVKCSTPGNRAPNAGEVSACRRWLEEEISIVKPRGAIVLGAVAKLGLVDPGCRVVFLEHPVAAIRDGRVEEYARRFCDAVGELEAEAGGGVGRGGEA